MSPITKTHGLNNIKHCLVSHIETEKDEEVEGEEGKMSPV
jgi:hypothetical protein